MDDTIQHYDAAQLAAVQTAEKRVLVLSVAGSGKTRVLVGRVQHLVESGVPASQIVCITFTTNAARVLQRRLGFKLGYCGTLHAFALRELNRRAQDVGFSPGIGVVDKEQSEAILFSIRAGQRYRGSEAELEAALREWPSGACNPTPAALVAAAYRTKLRQNNCMDFSGLLHYFKLLLLKTWNTSNGTWPYKALLVDEYQDASTEHADVYSAMPAEWRFLVGDENQGIYSFLGGDVANIVREARFFAAVLRLETNYRSCAAVCAAATRLVRSGGGSEVVLPRPDAPQGRAELHYYADLDAELRGIAQKVREAGCEASCAVLLRTNALADQYRAGLEAFSLPVAKRKESSNPPDWPVVRSLLAALSSPGNDLLAEAFIVALRGKDEAEKSRREAISKQVSLNEHCLHLPHGLNAVDAAKFVANKKPSNASLEKLDAALSSLEEDASVGDLLVALAEPEKQEATPGIVVTTVHSSKGLEFDTVFVPAMEEGFFPSTRDAADPLLLAEARRLAYVAFTRAKQNLFVSYCRTRREAFGRREEAERQASRFIAESGLTIDG